MRRGPGRRPRHHSTPLHAVAAGSLALALTAAVATAAPPTTPASTTRARFDLDGDGTLEALIATPNGLEVRRTSAVGSAAPPSTKPAEGEEQLIASVSLPPGLPRPTGPGTVEGVLVRAPGQAPLRVVHASYSVATPSTRAPVERGDARRLELVVAEGSGPTAAASPVAREGGHSESKPPSALRVIYAGVTGPVAPDGEWAERLAVGEHGILRWQTAPGVERCDGEERLFPSLYDGQAGRFRPVAFAAPTGEPLTATALSTVSTRPLGLLRWDAASSRLGDGGSAEGLRAPRELDDGDATTRWTEGAGDFGRGVFVTAHARAPGLSLRGLSLVLPVGSPLAKVAIVVGAGDATRTFDVALPVEARRRGAPLQVTLPSPIAAECVSLVLADVDAGGAAREVSIGEAALYTTLDAAAPEGGKPLADAARFAPLVDAVAAGGARANDLARVLGEAGEAAIGAILARPDWRAHPSLVQALLASRAPAVAAPLASLLVEPAPADVRRLAERTIAEATRAHTSLGRALDAALLDVATRKEAPEAARVDALGLVTSDALASPRFAAALPTLLTDETSPTVRAAFARAASGGDAATLLPPLARRVAKAASEGHADSLDEAVLLVGVLAARTHAAARAPSTTSSPAPPTTSDLRRDAADALVAVWRASRTDGWALRFRVLRALARVAAPSTFDVIAAAAREDDATLRAAAVDAAAALPDAAGAALVAAAVHDDDPHVRATALAGLARLASPSLPAAATAALDDRWPLVRTAAANRLEERFAATHAACHDATGDRLAQVTRRRDEPEVRRAALAALARCDSARAGTIALAIAVDASAPPSLREESAALAVAAHTPGAARALAQALAALLDDPRSDDRAIGVGAALATALPDAAGASPADAPTVDKALARAATEPPTPALRAAATRALARRCQSATPTARQALTHAATDPDPTVRRAALPCK